MNEGLQKDVDGLPMPKYFREEYIRSAISYKPRDGDTIIVTYPRCGTSWTLVITWNVITRAKPVCDTGEFGLMCPHLEMDGPGPAESLARMGPVMTHLPMSHFRPVDHAKYIYIARNPYDVAVSYYHFRKGLLPKTVSDVSFEALLRLFLNGKIAYGDYFDHLLPWYERRNDANVLLITYEQLKSDTKTQVLRIADFLGENHGAALCEDEAVLERVVEASSLDSMKALFSEKIWEKKKKMAALAQKKGIRFETLAQMPREEVETHEGSGFIRKGAVGDWRNYFTSHQIVQTKAWIATKTKGSDVMTLWKEWDLP